MGNLHPRVPVARARAVRAIFLFEDARIVSVMLTARRTQARNVRSPRVHLNKNEGAGARTRPRYASVRAPGILTLRERTRLTAQPAELRHSSRARLPPCRARWVFGDDIHTIFSQAHGDGARLRVRPHRGLREEARRDGPRAPVPRAPARAAPAVATALAARLGAAPEIYVLGDPVPRGAVDCVGAAHVDADALVKCGADCLTPPPDGAPPTLFVRGPAAAVDVAGVARHIEELLIEEGPALLLVAPSTPTSAGRSRRSWRRASAPCTASSLPAHVYDEAGPSPSFVVAGLGTDCVDEADFRRRRVAFVGAAGPLRDAVALRAAACACFVAVDPNGGGEAADALASRATRALARRRHALGRARQASRWGVVVAGAGRIAESARAARACDALIRETGRASYVIAVGPITPAKLANFAELEALCIVGADVETLETFGREVAVPLVAASELAVCLDRSRWLPEDAPFYSCDLADLAIDSEDHDSDDAPDFDLASGQCERPRVDLAYEPDQQGGDRRVDVGGGRVPPRQGLAGPRGAPRRDRGPRRRRGADGRGVGLRRGAGR